MTTKPDFEELRKEVERWSAGCPDSGYFTAADYIACDDARIEAEARVTKLKRQLAVAIDTLSAGFRDGGITEDHCFNAIQKIKEIEK